MTDSLFSTDERQYLFVRVHGDSESTLVPVCSGPSEFWEAVRFGITMVRRVERCFCQSGEHIIGGRQIRVSDSKGNDLDALCFFCRYLATDLDKQVWGYFVDSTGELHVSSKIGSCDHHFKKVRRPSLHMVSEPPSIVKSCRRTNPNVQDSTCCIYCHVCMPDVSDKFG